ncbi:MAG TPA: ABC transporter substrate-binding protein [Gemmatimonadaceae bacterium]|jgi:branched-chain amino acid transport system substrate-binding protein|nr:ABC transporter substrate-binding protein [Gemmatimonadaceae bacterium]
MLRWKVGFLLVPALWGCSRDARPVTLGAAGPWTSPYGALARRGIDLAVDEINASGGIHGRPLRILARDDMGSGMKAVEVAQEFVGNHEVLGVVGHLSSGAMMAAARIYDTQLAAVPTSATSPDLTGISRWVFRVIPSDSVTGIDLAHFAAHLGRRRAAVLYENDSYGRGLAQAFEKSFNGSIVSADPIDPTTTSYEPYVAYFRRLSPDLVFVAGTDVSGIAVLREARREKLQADFLGGDGWTGVAVDTSDAEGVYVATPFTDTDTRPEVQKFVAAYRARYGVLPPPDAALAYDATKLLATAIGEGGATRAGVQRYLASLDAQHPFVGVVGPVHFASTGDPIGKSLTITRVHRGALVVTQGGA